MRMRWFRKKTGRKPGFPVHSRPQERAWLPAAAMLCLATAMNGCVSPLTQSADSESEPPPMPPMRKYVIIDDMMGETEPGQEREESSGEGSMDVDASEEDSEAPGKVDEDRTVEPDENEDGNL